MRVNYFPFFFRKTGSPATPHAGIPPHMTFFFRKAASSGPIRLLTMADFKTCSLALVVTKGVSTVSMFRAQYGGFGEGSRPRGRGN